MTEKFYEEDVDEWIIENRDEACCLFEKQLPGYSSKLDRLDKRIAKILKEIREVFPDAQFYTSGGDGFSLVLGQTHEGPEAVAQQHRVAWDGIHAHISGGDW